MVFLKKCCAFLLYKFPFVDALTLLMLFGERAKTESMPPISPKLVYIYLFGSIACGVLLSSGLKQKAACLVYSGQMLYLTINIVTNPKWDYPMWQKMMITARQIGVFGTYILFAFVLDKQRNMHLRRIGEIILGIYFLCYVYLINTEPQCKTALVTHILGGDYTRYLIVLTLAGCGLTFFSGVFIRDMSLCAAITLLLVMVFVDLDLGYWVNSGVLLWNQLRLVQSSACTIVGLLFVFCTMDNKLKAD